MICEHKLLMQYLESVLMMSVLDVIGVVRRISRMAWLTLDDVEIAIIKDSIPITQPDCSSGLPDSALPHF